MRWGKHEVGWSALTIEHQAVLAGLPVHAPFQQREAHLLPQWLGGAARLLRGHAGRGDLGAGAGRRARGRVTLFSNAAAH